MAIADVLELQLHKYGDTKNTYYLQNYCSEVKLSNSMTQLAAELSFKISYATMSSNLLPIVIEEGDVILLTYTSVGIVNTLFNGVVTDADLKGKDQTLQITAYDYLWWICKCNITKNFNNISVGNALEYIYKFIDATHVDVSKELGDNANIMIGSHLVQNKPVHKVITVIYNYVRKIKNTGYFYLYATGNGKEIDVREADKTFSGMTIHPAYTDSNGEVQGNLIDYEIRRSMQNMVTQVDFYKSTGEPFSSIGTGGSIFSGSSAKYGTIIENVEVEDNDSTGQRALAKGNKILSEKGKPTVDITVTCMGDLLYQIGYGVVVQLPNTTYYDICMYIVSSEWTWNLDGSFISKLELSQSQYSDYTDWDDIETKKAQESDSTSGYSNTATSSLVINIVNELKKYQGVAYVWGGKDPSGFDCSGYIAYVYNEFSDQLEITSNDGKLTAQTYVMKDQGKDVTSDFKDNLRIGDIIFPGDNADDPYHHVVAYIGNNQVIHAPHTGDVVKISDIYFDKASKVIRVIPDSAWNTEGTASSSGKYSSQLVEFTKSWEGYRATVYYDTGGTATIGYGTTAAANAGAIAQGNCSQSEAEGWLESEMDSISEQIEKAANNKGVTLNQFYFDCLCDICYQWGYPTILTNDKNSIFSSLCNGDLDTAKSGIKSLGYGRRDSARCDILDGTYTLNN